MGTLLGTSLYAINENIERLHTQEPMTKVGLVTFGSDVYVQGDCSKPTVSIPESITKDMDKIKKKVEDETLNMLENPISSSKSTIQGALYNTKTIGMTALGPSALASVLMASRNRLCSTVVIATDGAANVGLGSFNY